MHKENQVRRSRTFLDLGNLGQRMKRGDYVHTPAVTERRQCGLETTITVKADHVLRSSLNSITPLNVEPATVVDYEIDRERNRMVWRTCLCHSSGSSSRNPTGLPLDAPHDAFAKKNP